MKVLFHVHGLQLWMPIGQSLDQQMREYMEIKLADLQGTWVNCPALLPSYRLHPSYPVLLLFHLFSFLFYCQCRQKTWMKLITSHAYECVHHVLYKSLCYIYFILSLIPYSLFPYVYLTATSELTRVTFTCFEFKAHSASSFSVLYLFYFDCICSITHFSLSPFPVSTCQQSHISVGFIYP